MDLESIEEKEKNNSEMSDLTDDKGAFCSVLPIIKHVLFYLCDEGLVIDLVASFYMIDTIECAGRCERQTGDSRSWNYEGNSWKKT
jgi:hypothetical protein